MVLLGLGQIVLETLIRTFFKTSRDAPDFVAIKWKNRNIRIEPNVMELHPRGPKRTTSGLAAGSSDVSIKGGKHS